MKKSDQTITRMEKEAIEQLFTCFRVTVRVQTDKFTPIQLYSCFMLFFETHVK